MKFDETYYLDSMIMVQKAVLRVFKLCFFIIFAGCVLCIMGLIAIGSKVAFVVVVAGLIFMLSRIPWSGIVRQCLCNVSDSIFFGRVTYVTSYTAGFFKYRNLVVSVCMFDGKNACLREFDIFDFLYLENEDNVLYRTMPVYVNKNNAMLPFNKIDIERLKYCVKAYKLLC